VESPPLRARLREIIDVVLHDDEQAWQLDADGRWTKVPPVAGTGTNARLRELAVERSRREGAATPRPGPAA
jgi:hypothetical protein